MRIVRTSSISLHVRPSFVILSFLLAIFIGAKISISLLMMGVLFLVFFLHELGHVVIARFLGRPCEVTIGGAGGSTEVFGPRMKFWQRIAVLCGGPAATYLVIAGTKIWLFDAELLPTTLRETLYTLYTLSVGWFWLNILPLYPFDGGVMALDTGKSLFGRFGEKSALIISILTSLLLTIHFLVGQIMIGVFACIYCLMQSFSRLRHPSISENSDLSEETLLLHKLRQRWHNGEQDQVIEQLKKMTEESQEKEIRQEALDCCSGYLLSMEQSREAYDLLNSAQDPLTPSSLEHFTLAAYRTSHWHEGLEAGREAFRGYPSLPVATLCAMLAARAEMADEAVHWLQTAISLGLQKVSEVISSDDFDLIRSTTAFKKFVAEASRKAL